MCDPQGRINLLTRIKKREYWIFRGGENILRIIQNPDLDWLYWRMMKILEEIEIV